ncbi:MAG: formate/nitrite transporter family protein [Lachnospiraceae bacterium]|nr:formate/nitrite transporter family protein [Lachnospiraceae bacterium]
MNKHYYTPAEVLDVNMTAGEEKVQLPIFKLILLGIMAGAFVAFGAVASSTAIFGVTDLGTSRLIAGCIFPVGLMMITFAGGELITSNCMLVAGVMDKRFGVWVMIRTLACLYLGNLIGASVIAVVVYFSDILNSSNGALGAYMLKVAYGKTSLTPVAAVCSGILCNILVCVASLKAIASKDIAGKVWALFFPIMLFVVSGFEHCVADMFYIVMGMIAAMNEKYVVLAEELYGLTTAQIDAAINIGGFFSNQIPVTIGNIIGGMVFVALPIFVIHKGKSCNK